MDCAELPDGGVLPRAASHQDQDRLLQRWSAKGQIRECRLRLPRIWLQAALRQRSGLAENVLRVHACGEQTCAERDAVEDPKHDAAQADGGDAGRHRPRAKPDHPGMDRVLWAIYPFGAISPGSLHRPDVGRLDQAQVQTLPPPTGSSARVSHEDRARKPTAVRTLAAWRKRRADLMGAG